MCIPNSVLNGLLELLQIAQHMQINVRQFLCAVDPYYTFLTLNLCVLNSSVITKLATRVLLRAATEDDKVCVSVCVTKASSIAEKCSTAYATPTHQLRDMTPNLL